MDKRSDIKFEFCIPAVPVSNPVVADLGFSITIVLMVLCSAGSIPDSYDIYRYLNLVRYFRRKLAQNI